MPSMRKNRKLLTGAVVVTLVLIVAGVQVYRHRGIESRRSVPFSLLGHPSRNSSVIPIRVFGGYCAGSKAKSSLTLDSDNVEESESTVTITAQLGPESAADRHYCPDVGLVTFGEVHLSHPLGSRVVLDGSRSAPSQPEVLPLTYPLVVAAARANIGSVSVSASRLRRMRDAFLSGERHGRRG